ncbi:MAG: D-tyrosyl-tRNA(Tyr) deacylase [Planctomycetes bacterium]|nr:D-tyrosyl-tRNA(Tyr) deacylase [Planctomycetota bacterium]
MRALLQRVSRGTVRIDDSAIAEIGRGVVLLVGVEVGDDPSTAEAMARKIAGLRIFDDPAGKMNLSNEDIGGEYLVVSQFTLCADLSKGKRPGFEGAMKPPESERLYRVFCDRLAGLTRRPVRTGRFGASMTVEIHSDGPATFWLETGRGRS